MNHLGHCGLLLSHLDRLHIVNKRARTASVQIVVVSLVRNLHTLEQPGRCAIASIKRFRFSKSSTATPAQLWIRHQYQLAMSAIEKSVASRALSAKRWSRTPYNRLTSF
jgi:hypothetical protein